MKMLIQPSARLDDCESCQSSNIEFDVRVEQVADGHVIAHNHFCPNCTFDVHHRWIAVGGTVECHDLFDDKGVRHGR